MCDHKTKKTIHGCFRLKQLEGSKKYKLKKSKIRILNKILKK